MAATVDKPCHLRAQKRVIYPAKFQACESSAWLQNTMGLLQHIGDGCAVPDTESDSVEIIRVIWEMLCRKCLSIGLTEGDLWGYGLVRTEATRKE